MDCILDSSMYHNHETRGKSSASQILEFFICNMGKHTLFIMQED